MLESYHHFRIVNIRNGFVNSIVGANSFSLKKNIRFLRGQDSYKRDFLNLTLILKIEFQIIRFERISYQFNKKGLNFCTRSLYNLFTVVFLSVFITTYICNQIWYETVVELKG